MHSRARRANTVRAGAPVRLNDRVSFFRPTHPLAPLSPLSFVEVAKARGSIHKIPKILVASKIMHFLAILVVPKILLTTLQYRKILDHFLFSKASGAIRIDLSMCQINVPGN